MSYTAALKMPSSYAVMNEEEMTYLEGGISISKNVFKYTCNAAITAGLVCLSGGLAVGGLKTVLGSMSLKKELISIMVKTIGKMGIAAGNTLSSKFMSGLIGCVTGDFLGNVFDKYIDNLDGVMDGKVKIG